MAAAGRSRATMATNNCPVFNRRGDTENTVTTPRVGRRHVLPGLVNNTDAIFVGHYILKMLVCTLRQYDVMFCRRFSFGVRLDVLFLGMSLVSDRLPLQEPF